MAVPTGLEPAPSSVTGKHTTQLCYDTIWWLKKELNFRLSVISRLLYRWATQPCLVANLGIEPSKSSVWTTTVPSTLAVWWSSRDLHPTTFRLPVQSCKILWQFVCVLLTLFRPFGCGGWIWTTVLWGMNPTSYQTATTPRWIKKKLYCYSFQSSGSDSEFVSYSHISQNV